eukprot:TRINITY_DN1507_c0_g1_i1.p1 TRINITY_DN1507_c0_g1~~TRINITY_DN1507_c0_g1_i1.p1  ORF type:complete len:348 (-),score=55.89 TRINITY_DN1507_c0_g1_i1:23-1066(-)
MEHEGWQKLDDRYYRKFEIYEMSWGALDFSKLKLVGCPYGGALAVTRDDTKIIKISGADSSDSISIYTSYGKKLAEFMRDKERIVKMGWSDLERLVIVLANGTVLLYTALGELQRRFLLEGPPAEDGVMDSIIWGTGLVVLTNRLQLFAVMSLEVPYTIPLKNPGLDSPPTSWTIIEPQFTKDGETVEVLLATSTGTIIVVTDAGFHDMLLSNGPFTSMSVSPTGKILACFTKTGNVWVVSTDFAKNLSTFETRSPKPPEQLVWCGTDAVVLYWERDNLLFIIGPNNNWIKYQYDEPLYLVPECDGIRIFSKRLCEFLHRVPNVTESIFKVAGTSPAALLYLSLIHI